MELTDKIQTYKENLTKETVMDICDKLGAKYKPSVEGLRIQTICHNSDGEGGLNLSYNEKTKAFTCYSGCNCSYDIINLIKKAKNYKTTAACKFLGITTEGVEVEDVYRYHWNYLKRFQANTITVVNNIFDKGILESLDKIIYLPWVEEGISPETQDKYNIRWYERLSQVCIPIYAEDGNLVGIRVRNIDPTLEANAKYDILRLLDGTEFKCNTSNLLYGLNYNKGNIQSKRKIVLAEAEKSVLKCDTMFEDNICVALLGHRIQHEKVKKILELGISEIVIALDWDYEDYGNYEDYEGKDYATYVKNVIKLAEPFRNHVDKISVILPCGDFEYKQSPMDYSKEEYIECYENRISMEDFWEKNEKVLDK